ncbi:class I SAM-dependent methyltransferase [Alphaproteobacteria bacterium]|nr:class I SAM-dependent methyltransferase [Alphaproteobacteria bacterium]
MTKNYITNPDPSLEAEAQAFDERATERFSNGFLPDLQCQTRNEYFYKSFWRDSTFTDLYVGQMSRQYIEYIRSLKLKSPRVLDFGCGQGYFSLELAREGCEVVGVDISSKSIAIAESYHQSIAQEQFHPSRLKYYCGDVNILPDLGDFDAVLTSGVLHHLEDLNDALNIMGKSLRRRNGILFGHEPQHKYFTKNDATIVATIRQLLSLCGNWYEDPKVVEDDIGLIDYSNQIQQEYLFERDINEKAQSPHDLSHDRDQIINQLGKHFDKIDIRASSAFIYRMLGGLRANKIKKEHELAKFLATVDKVFVSQNILNANYFFFIASNQR